MNKQELFDLIKTKIDEGIAEHKKELAELIKPHKTIDKLLQDTMLAVQSKDVAPEDESLIRNIENKVLQLRGDVDFGGKEFKDYSADELSRIAGDLAIYKVNLGSLFSRVDFYREMAEQYAKAKRSALRNIATEQATLKKNRAVNTDEKQLKPTVDEIKDELYSLNLPAKTIFAVRQEFSNRCLYLWRSVNSLLDAIEQRIRVLQSDRSDARHYDNSMTDTNIKDCFQKDLEEEEKEIESKIKDSQSSTATLEVE